MGSCAAPSAKGDDKFITTDYLQQCPQNTFRSHTRLSVQFGQFEKPAFHPPPFRMGSSTIFYEERHDETTDSNSGSGNSGRVCL
ncbi:hypothetical protein F7M23_20455 [Salmonella enterica]|nr:hypothetical protein [Salmonella enterica]EBF3562205.1 hypothetical protein [Salmonella enterica subsp. enterica serovar Typhimurium]EAT7391477.1 hypothetical protein [Salmonella enterica]EBI6692595.1 hypothetical protein [Salmonella enterica]ECK0737908.1 hypothetical protein [Salmonella enterica subsp. enterica serovar Typhimurium]